MEPRRAESTEGAGSAGRSAEEPWTVSEEIGIIPHSMRVPFPCSTKTELLNAYRKATRRYAGAVGKMMQQIRTLPHDEYESLTIATGQARNLTFEALDALNAHLHEHGC